MITPDNQIPLDDSDNSENEDQPSQQDIHGNGFDDIAEENEVDDNSDPASLQQAYDAAESAYTLDIGDDGDTDNDD
ncbi:hypothetical protein [Mucilaginibacter sp.]|uniref:hypothetical protein n=1 Tax=Mucilaginibacter sp. TaxID=1882438 RepID=UPI0025E86928|nr:hypothetical protein [Mucilaginibacter sp.]